MRQRRLVLVTVLAAGVAGLSACGGSDDPAAEPSSTPSTTASAPTEPSVATGTPSSYLPVPGSVTLTEPGSALALKDPAVVAWTPRQDLVGVVEVAVTRIEQTSIEKSFGDFDLSDEESTSTPYFVRLTATNVGETDLGSRQLPVYLSDSLGSLVVPTGIARDFEPCGGSTLPAIFAPGDETKSCLVFFVPQGHDLQSVMFRPPEGVVPLTWTGRVRQVKADKRDNKAASDGKAGNAGRGDQAGSGPAAG